MFSLFFVFFSSLLIIRSLLHLIPSFVFLFLLPSFFFCFFFFLLFFNPFCEHLHSFCISSRLFLSLFYNAFIFFHVYFSLSNIFFHLFILLYLVHWFLSFLLPFPSTQMKRVSHKTKCLDESSRGGGGTNKFESQ